MGSTSSTGGLLQSGIGAGLGLIGGIISGIIGNRAHQKYANALENVNMAMPEALGQAQSLYNRMAYQQMPGYETMLQGVDANTANTMTMAQQVANSPAALLDALIQSSTAGENQKRNIGIENANYQTQMAQNLARFLGTTKAGYQNEINQFNVDKQISALKERMLGTQELMQGITGGLGSAFSNWGAGQQANFQQQRANALMNYFNGGSSSGVAAPSIGGGSTLASMLAAAVANG